MNLLPEPCGASLISMSVSWICPVELVEVVVVVAMTASPLSQQSYWLEQPPLLTQGSLAGTAVLQLCVRKNTRLWLVSPWKKPTLRAAGSVESGSSSNFKSEQVTPAQVW